MNGALKALLLLAALAAAWAALSPAFRKEKEAPPAPLPVSAPAQAALPSGAGAPPPRELMEVPKAQVLLIAVNGHRAMQLAEYVESSRPEAKGLPSAVFLTGPETSERVAGELSRARREGVKYIGIDGEVYAPDDRVVGGLLIRLRKSGVFVAGMEFVD